MVETSVATKKTILNLNNNKYHDLTRNATDGVEHVLYDGEDMQEKRRQHEVKETEI